MIWENGIETCIIYMKRIASPGYRMLGAGALRRPRGMVQGGRWEGGFRMGNMCIPVVDSC